MPTSPDDSVFNEPQFQEREFKPDPAEDVPPPPEESADKGVENAVWDEPALAGDLTQTIPADAMTYKRWLLKRRAATSAARSWLVTLAVAVAAGPWAVVGAVWGSGETLFSAVAIIAVAPLVEETMKISIPLYIVERRPFLFRSTWQILLCGCVAGMAFACIENILYLKIYIRAPSPGIILWRWTVCSGVHVVCSTIAALGAARAWRGVWQRRARPNLDITYPYMLSAVLLHGAYNTFALAYAIGKS